MKIYKFLKYYWDIVRTLIIGVITWCAFISLDLQRIRGGSIHSHKTDHAEIISTYMYRRPKMLENCYCFLKFRGKLRLR